MIHVNINSDDIERAINRMPRELFEEVTDGLDFIKNRFFKRFRSERLGGPPGVRGASGKGLFGQFKSHISRPGSKKGLGLTMFTNSKIAKAHEFGEEIKDPSGGFLAIPLSARKKMFTRGKLRSRFKNIRSLKNTFKIILKGKLFIAQRPTKKSREIVPLFVLQRAVQLKKRLGYFDLWDRFEPQAFQMLSKSVGRGVRRAWDRQI